MCYIYPSVLANVFSTSIQRLPANTKKPDVNIIQQDTTQKLSEIRAEQFWHQCQKEIIAYLQELADAPINGKFEFESHGHEKGIQTNALPNKIEEDINSGVCPTSDWDMVKKAKCACMSSNPNKLKRKKNIHKRPCLEEEANIEVEERDEVEHYDDTGANAKDKMDKDVPLPNPRAEPFLPFP